MEVRDINPSRPFSTQLAGADKGPVTVIEMYLAPEGTVEAWIESWSKHAHLMKAQPGFISSQLYRGVGESRALTDVTVWESAAALQNAISSQEHHETLSSTPDGSVAYPILMRRTAVNGICVA